MKLLVDFFPILLFFAAYKLEGIYVATGVAIAASAVLVGWSWIRRRQVETMPLITLGLLVLFGGLTLALRDPIFVMWKPTIVNWLFAAVFLGSQFIGERPLIERMMGKAIEIPPAVWLRLNMLWIGFFFVTGLVNLFVVYVGSGFFGAREALILASGLQDIDLSTCAERFGGDLLALCDNAHAREDVWVNFKLFGMMGMTIVFVIAQAIYLSRHMKDEPSTLEAD
ncbi:inner membrane-spanning protein YciB [Thiocapsa marina]|uniref:Inner membrane-spanning protein YciB n=1 Tax=Thiocapsa marina 5811 TaxID=768671 RepID=F9UBQ5_9GAMM|nr:inner membrane-spanning protein YciB [Thiocapsa marina]EGV18373.1 intracellular septation protein [Thiocapsa marina 5811]